MQVLWLEDRGSSVEEIKKYLEKRGFYIIKALSVSTAIGLWFEKGSDYNFIIVDLNVSSEGLTIDQYKETKDGVLSGFIFLKYYVFPKINPEFKSNIIIYSNYIDEFLSYTRTREREGLKIIGKQETNAAKFLCDYIIEKS